MIRKYPKKNYKSLKRSIETLEDNVQRIITTEQNFGVTLLEMVKRTNSIIIFCRDLQSLLIDEGILSKVDIDKEEDNSIDIKLTSFKNSNSEDKPN